MPDLKETEIAFDYRRIDENTERLQSEQGPEVSNDGDTSQYPDEVSGIERDYTNISCFNHIIALWIIRISMLSWATSVIVALSTTSYLKERHKCLYSELWSYLLLSLIIDSLCYFYYEKVNSEVEEYILLNFNNKVLRVLSIKSFFLSTWGSFLFFSFSCISKLRNTWLFWVALYNYFLNIISIGILLLIYLKTYFDKLEQERIRREQIQQLSEGLAGSNEQQTSIQI